MTPFKDPHPPGPEPGGGKVTPFTSTCPKRGDTLHVHVFEQTVTLPQQTMRDESVGFLKPLNPTRRTEEYESPHTQNCVTGGRTGWTSRRSRSRDP